VTEPSLFRRRQTLPARGRRQGAEEHLTTATTMYREMDIQFWLEKAEMTESA